jgi:ASC-1-like (ASCH) protein
MRLHDGPFKKVKDGTKTVELRLYDEKRKGIKVGDKVTFKNRLTNEELEVEITDICTYSNFEELYKHHGKKSMGYDKDDIASPADMNVYYDPREVAKYGVVALEFKLL